MFVLFRRTRALEVNIFDFVIYAPMYKMTRPQPPSVLDPCPVRRETESVTSCVVEAGASRSAKKNPWVPGGGGGRYVMPNRGHGHA